MCKPPRPSTQVEASMPFSRTRRSRGRRERGLLDGCEVALSSTSAPAAGGVNAGRLTLALESVSPLTAQRGI